MNRKIFETLCTASALALSVAGCATPTVESPPLEVLEKVPVPEPLPEPDLDYTIRTGDRLSNIAFALTGSTENWTAIADRNQIDDPRLLRVGDILIIPRELVSKEGDAAQAASPGTAGANRADANDGAGSTAAPVRSSSTGNAAASNRSGSLPLPETDTTGVTVTAVADRPQPVKLRRPLEPRATPEPAVTRSVEVSGSYYPRGIYAKPNGDARLIMRAAPGAMLPLERSIDNWYRVTTSQGAGYIRASDARIVESSATPGSTASSN